MGLRMLISTNLGIIFSAMKYAIYDFDGTLLQTQTVPFILRHWQASSLPKTKFKKIKNAIIFRYVLMKLKVFGIQYDQFRYWAMAKVGQLFSTISIDELSKFLDDLFLASKPLLHKKVVKQILKDKQEGFHTVLLSGNFDVFLERYRSLGFDDILGTRLFDNNAKVILPLSILSADQKISAIMKKIPSIQWDKTKAYTDSYADITLLNQVKEAICVTPESRLLKTAKTNGWRVIL
jgi:phosphoserine phosphatase